MKRILAIGILVSLFGFSADSAYSRTVTVVKNTNETGSQDNIYNRDLCVVENYLFGRTYQGNSINVRLNRIENELFSKNYPSMEVSNRMNNILANYRDDYQYRSNYLSNFYDNSTPVSRLKNRFIGYPTGFTPQIMTTPFGSVSSPMINRSYTSNRGYYYNNNLPVTTGSGIQILR